jgi:hypothetical protein
MTANGRPPIPLEVKQRRGTLRSSRLPPNGLTEVSRLPIDSDTLEPPEHLLAAGLAFWGSVFQSAHWLWPEVDRSLIVMTADLFDERESLRGLIDLNPEDTRLRAALRALDKQLVSNLSLLGLTPSDRSRLGLIEVKQQSKLEELMARRAARDLPGWEQQDT